VFQLWSLARGLTTQRHACPRCGSHNIRRSTRFSGIPFWLIGLDAQRCRACRLWFLLRGEVARRLEPVGRVTPSRPGGAELKPLDEALQKGRPKP